MQRPYWSQISIRDLRQRNVADKAARQCRCEIGVYSDGSRLLVDITLVGGRHCTLRSHTPFTPLSPQPLVGDRVNAAAAGMTQSRIPHPLASLGNRSPSNIESRRRRRSSGLPFLGVDVDDPRRFVPFVMEASEPRREPFWSTYVLSVTFQFCVFVPSSPLSIMCG
jgi:hypothetical protein